MSQLFLLFSQPCSHLAQPVAFLFLTPASCLHCSCTQRYTLCCCILYICVSFSSWKCFLSFSWVERSLHVLLCQSSWERTTSAVEEGGDISNCSQWQLGLSLLTWCPLLPVAVAKINSIVKQMADCVRSSEQQRLCFFRGEKMYWLFCYCGKRCLCTWVELLDACGSFCKVVVVLSLQGQTVGKLKTAVLNNARQGKSWE